MTTLLTRFTRTLATVAAIFGLACALPAQATETIIYLHNDISGSPQAATDASGNVLWKESYTPYGERAVNSPSSATGKGTNQLYFHGKKVEDLNGGVHLSYFGARYYDPSLGRFLQPDPIAFHESSVHSFNRYAYGNNNPYKFTDPDGHQATPMSNDPRLFAEQAWARFVVNANAASDAMVSFATRSTASFQGILRKSKKRRKSLIQAEFSTLRRSSGFQGNPPEAETFMSIFVSIFAGTAASGLLLGC